MDQIWQDLRYGFRQLKRNPGFSLVAIFTLALGIGANTAIFSVVNAVLLNPFPYAEPGRLMFLASTFANQPGTSAVTYPDYLDWKKQNQSLQHLTIARNNSFNLTGVEEPLRVDGAVVSAEMFPLLGVAPQLGRGFSADEDREGASRVAVLSHGLWMRRFGGDPQVVNRVIKLDDQPYTVVGIMPARFKFWGADVWVPAALNFEGELHDSRVARMGFLAVGRLKPGLSIDQARADMSVVAKRLEEAYPDSNKGLGVKITPLTESVTANIRPALLVLLGAVALVLLIACANVANLLLARAAVREKEMSVRTALGAGRGRLVFQLLTESLPLALLGAGLGLGLAFGGIRVLMAFIPEGSIPAEAVVRIDLTVLLFTLGIAVLTAVAFGLVPALQTARAQLTQGLKDGMRTSSGGRQGHRVRNALVITEVAMSLALLVGASLLMKSFARLQTVDPGFKSAGVLQMAVSLPLAKYPRVEAMTAFFDGVMERLARLPGVNTVAGSATLPFTGNGMGMPLVPEGRTYDKIQDLSFTQYHMIRGDYFQALGIPVLNGRTFSAQDTQSSLPVTIINRTAAEKHFFGQNPIGKRIKLGLPDNLNKEGILGKGKFEFPWLTIVGVVEDVKHYGLREDRQSQAYIPYVQGPDYPQMRATMHLLVRTTVNPRDLIASAREQVWTIDRDQPIASVSPMEKLLSDSLRQPRFSMILLGAFAVIALLLSGVGVYGVIAYSVSQRTREVGIRMALGAQRLQVLQLVLRQGFFLVLAGVAAGLAGTWALSRSLVSMLYEVSSTDPLTFTVVAVILSIVALMACYLPARRAAAVNPIVALRYE